MEQAVFSAIESVPESYNEVFQAADERSLFLTP